MKVKELVSKAHLYLGQRIKLVDHSTQTTFWTRDRYTFDLDSTEIERLMTLRVNSFFISESELTVHAE